MLEGSGRASALQWQDVKRVKFSSSESNIGFCVCCATGFVL